MLQGYIWEDEASLAFMPVQRKLSVEGALAWAVTAGTGGCLGGRRQEWGEFSCTCAPARGGVLGCFMSPGEAFF